MSAPTLVLQQPGGELKAACGEIVLIRGRVGSGKSLWLKRFAGLMPWPAGVQCSLGGSPWPREEAVVRMLFDAPVPLWLGQDVGEELAFGLPTRPDAAAMQTALAQWGLGQLELRTPLAQLNRLEAVRLVLAGMSLAHPALALLDNPTASLPPADGEALRQDIRAWAQKQRCIVLAACNRWQEWRKTAHRLWLIQADGRLAEHEWV